MSTVFMVPSQGHGVVSFQASAYHAARDVYARKAVVFRTTYAAGGGVSFTLDGYATPSKSAKDFWTEVQKCSTFVYVGHSGENDGPILAHEDGGTLYTADEWWSQPWHCVLDDPSTLDTAGKEFWGKVGKQDRPAKLKIVLLGCNSGKTYAGAVAAAAECTVFGAGNSFAAGNPGSVKPVLKSIKNGGDGGFIKWS